MGCGGSRVDDTYVLGVLEPGEVVLPDARLPKKGKVKRSQSYKDQKKLLKGKYKVELESQRGSSGGGSSGNVKGGPRRTNSSGQSSVVRSRSSPSLGGPGGSHNRGEKRGAASAGLGGGGKAPRLTNSAAQSARAKSRFRKAGNAVRASVRLKSGGRGGRIKRSASAGLAGGGTGSGILSSSGLSRDQFVCVDENKKAIGKGAFSYVRLAQSKYDQGYYALKCISKEKAARHKNTPRHLRNEKEILQGLAGSCPYVIRCYGSFQDPTFVYLVLEYVPGGELHRLIYHRKQFSHDMAVFYAAELLIALEKLHEQSIMYRDLKPENILIAADGHVRIVDFGFATRISAPDGRAMTKVGTPHYLAPEILDMHSNEGYTTAIDIWSWSCVFYEMVRGRPAFGTAMDSSYAVYLRVMKAKYKMPSSFKPEFKSLVRNLLEAKIEKRLVDIELIKSHKVFEKVDWDAAGQQRLRPPYVPRLENGECDTSHFDKWQVPQYRKASAEENGKFRDF